jgi:hypothetical protein
MSECCPEDMFSRMKTTRCQPEALLAHENVLYHALQPCAPGVTGKIHGLGDLSFCRT